MFPSFSLADPLGWASSRVEELKEELSATNVLEWVASLTGLLKELEVEENKVKKGEVAEVSCPVETWRCLSEVLEEGIHHFYLPGSLRR